MIEELVQLDKELFLFLNGLGTNTWDGFWMYMTKSLNSIPLYAVLLFLFVKNFGLKKLLVLVVIITLLITVTDQLSNFFKYGLGRLRPCHDDTIIDSMRLVKSYCGGKFSYFSAHAANSCAIAFLFFFIFKNKVKYIGYFLIVWAMLVSYSRIYIGVHFPLDVITGIAVGLLFGWLFSKLYIFAILKVKA